MECRECGADISIGSFFCGCCGRPVGGGHDGGGSGTGPSMQEIPAPGLSREPTRGRAGRGGHFLCAGCLGAFPDSEAVAAGTGSFCPACAATRSAAARPNAPDPARIVDPGLVVRERDLRGRGRLAVVVALLAALAAGVGFAVPVLRGGDRIDALTRPAEEGGPFDLRRRYQPGSRQAWEMRMRLEMEGAGSGGTGPGEAQIELLVAGRLVEEVLEVETDGAAEVRLRMEGATPSGRIVVDGREIPLDAMPGGFGMGDRMMLLRLDPWGEPLGGPEAGEEDEGGFEDLMLGRVGSVPRHPLATGEEWTTTVRLPMDSLPLGKGVAAEATLRFRVEGLVRHGGRSCAVIAVAGGVGAGGDALDFEVQVKGVHYVDTETGLGVRSALDVDFSGSVRIGGAVAEFTARMEMDLELL